MSRTLFLPAGYRVRPAPAYEHDVQEGGAVWQPDVYQDAYQRMILAGGRRRIIDVGCGRAGKLMNLKLNDPHLETLGVDYGLNVVYLREEYPRSDWTEVDLETVRPDDLRPELVAGATIICADVVEHLVDPMPLLRTLRAWVQDYGAREVVLSTPDRVLTRGPAHMGPPPNSCHVREWAFDEFLMLLRHVGFIDVCIRLTRSVDTSPAKHTIEAVCMGRDK